MPLIRAVGIDMAFANMGLARVAIQISPADGSVKIHAIDLGLVSTEKDDSKQVRKSSDDLSRAVVLHKSLVGFTKGLADLAFAEVPSGSQSASAARSLGIAVGVLASCPVPVIEVSPMEVKRLFSPNGKRKVPKTEIMAWAMQQWPALPWLVYKGKPKLDNEHLADAMAVIVAGIETPEFKRMVAINHAVPSTNSHRPSSNRRSLY